VQELSGALPYTDLEGNRVWLGERGCILSCISFVDRLKPGVEELIARLRKRGLQLSILSGDRGPNVEQIARHLGIRHAIGELTPDQKIDAVRQIQSQGAVVLMVGDGINDAPVLCQAQVSIAMGTGAALAQSTADMILLRDDLAGVDSLLRLALRTTRIIRQNLLWATLYNFAAVPLAAAGLISPWIAGLGMAASSAVVVLNALRLAPAMRITPLPIAAGPQWKSSTC
jgi:Cu2+-exporting ATPase